MKREDVKIGMKVVPHSKSVGCKINDSNIFKTLKNGEKKYVYVIGKVFYEEGIFALGETNKSFLDMESFKAEDFEPYIGEIKQEDIEVSKIKVVMEDEKIGLDYESEYNRLIERYKELQQENEDLKKALVKIALKL